MVKIKRIQCGIGNCFLLEDGDNAILVDASQTKYMGKILDACRGKTLRLLVLTHGHLDHIQNAADLAEALNIPIAMHQSDYGLIQNNLHQPLSAHTPLGKLVLRVSMRGLEHDSVKPFEPSLFIKEGDTLEAYGVGVAVVELPGHTKGSIGIMVGESDLIVGDALMNLFYPSKSLLYNHRDDMEKSAAKIGSLSARTIHFGHGKSAPNRTW